jgi:CheY-like chemotaxis protein/anti-sigma regulatory factor (Ser/Thr protein kinase)
MLTKPVSRLLADSDSSSASRPIGHERLAIAAHEIRNPAQALMGLTDMLSAMPLSPEAQACAKVIRQSAQAILAVVDDAIDLVRLREGLIEFVAEPFDPRLVIGSLVELLHRQAAAKQLDLAGFCDPDIPSLVIGDAARIRQVLLNLAGNAIKFTEEGGVGIALRRAEDGALLFSVEDTGPGFAEADRAALFSAFASTAHDQGGLGLGLTVSAGIAGALGGSLSVEARPEGGTCFCLTLNCPEAAEASLPKLPAQDKRPVLIVSAAPFTGPYLAEKLQALGHETALIARPERAGLWLAEHPGAVLLADAALGQRGLDVAIHRALAVGCQAIALLLSSDEGKALKPLAGEMEWPVIRKPTMGRQASLRLDAIGRSADLPEPAAGPLALIADDCPINRLLACRLLEQEGYRTVAVSDGTEAIDCVAQCLSERSEPFNLILIDMRMPGLDGFMTARQIRGMEALFLVPPSFIAGLSAVVTPEMMTAGTAEGMDDVVTKPLTPSTLMRLRDAAALKSVMQLSEAYKTDDEAALNRGRFGT